MGRKGQIAWNKGLEGIHLSPESEFKKGRITTKEHRHKISMAMKNRIFSEEHKKKIGLAHKGRSNPLAKELGLRNKGKIPWNKGLTKNDPRVMKYSRLLIGKKKSPEHIEKIRLRVIEDRKNGIYSIKPNKPEQQLTQLFQQHNLSFQYTGDGKFWIGYSNPDFVDEQSKKIIEFDGKYWHNLPGNIVQDERRNLVYLDAGYDVMLINEDNLKDEQMLMEDIKDFAGDI